RRTDDLDAATVRAHRHLPEPGDHLLAAHLLLGLGPAVPEIVDAEHDDRVGDAGLGQDIAVEVTHPRHVERPVLPTRAERPARSYAGSLLDGRSRRSESRSARIRFTSSAGDILAYRAAVGLGELTRLSLGAVNTRSSVPPQVAQRAGGASLIPCVISI